MFQPLEWFIGLRYLRSRRWRALVSFRTAASLLGLALGVTALIVILSVLNGLETETRTRLLALSAHATVSAPRRLRRLARARAALRERAGRRGRRAVRAARRHARGRRQPAAGDRARHFAGGGGRGFGLGAPHRATAPSRTFSPARTASCSAQRARARTSVSSTGDAVTRARAAHHQRPKSCRASRRLPSPAFSRPAFPTTIPRSRSCISRTPAISKVWTARPKASR